MPHPEHLKAAKQRQDKVDAHEKEIDGMRQSMQGFINACLLLKENPNHGEAKLNFRSDFNDYMSALEEHIDKRVKK
jgi:hypothetical protein